MVSAFSAVGLAGGVIQAEGARRLAVVGELGGRSVRPWLRAEQRDLVTEIIGRYNPDAVVAVGVPFGHTRPQWILPHGGTLRICRKRHSGEVPSAKAKSQMRTVMGV